MIGTSARGIIALSSGGRIPHLKPGEPILVRPIEACAAECAGRVDPCTPSCLGGTAASPPRPWGPPSSVPYAIGLSGFGRAGKTAAAMYLERTYGYRRLHIAEPLRDMLRVLLQHYGYDAATIDRYLTGDLKESVIPQLGVTSRRAQITLGTEWGRKLIAPDLWADLWAHMAKAGGRGAMNDSVRFPNEERKIRGINGKTILIRRKGTKPIAFKWGAVGRFLFDTFGCMWGAHDSERTDRLRPDVTIDNDGSLEDLYRALDAAVASLKP